MFWHKISAGFIKPTLKFAGNIIIPVTATAIIWNTMNNLVTVLAVILLFTLILEKWGVNVKVFTRLSNTKVGKMLMIFMRSGSMVTKLNERYFEETSELIVDQGKIVMETSKKIKEEINMSKIKVFQENSLIWLKYNKKDILGNTALILLALDRYFGISVKYGLPPDAANWAAGLIFVLVILVMGGEGWTGNIINRVRENKVIAETEKNKKTKEYKTKLARVDKEIKLIIKKYGIKNVLPESIKPDYIKLMSAKQEYEKKIKEILDAIDAETK